MADQAKLHRVLGDCMKLAKQNGKVVFSAQYIKDARADRVRFYTFFAYLKRRKQFPESAEELRETLELLRIKEGLSLKVLRTEGQKAVLELVWVDEDRLLRHLEAQRDENREGVQTSPIDFERAVNADLLFESEASARKARNKELKSWED